jgi:hypothetical protein
MAIFDDDALLEGEPDGSSIEGVTTLLQRQQETLNAVATNQDVGIKQNEARYHARQKRIAAGLKRIGMSNPFPWRSLWEWHGRWTAGDMPRYRDRRGFIAGLVNPVYEELERRASAASVADWSAEAVPTWEALNERLEALKVELDRGASVDDFQDVGRRAREIIIDGVNLIFDDSMVPEGEDVPKTSDAKSRLDMYLAKRLSGPARADIRKLLRIPWDAAQVLTHFDDATRVDAYAIAQATVLVIRTLQENEK